ncbi:MAG: hypothetical protein JWN46_799 [Acidimicrobiales bacterium]|nr:hypothetical protein [Acidimicrobiales bacterium]
MQKLQKAVTGVAIVATLVGAGVAWGRTSSSNPPGQPATRPTQRSFPGRDLGGGTTETKLVSITPCRVVDTRLGGGPLAPGFVRHLKVRGGGGVFATQGGKSGGCGIPTGATAIEATVSAVFPTGRGYLHVFPAATAEPNATFINYSVGSISNAGHLPVCAASCVGDQDLDVKAFQHATHLVIDVSGYAVKPMSAAVTGIALIERSSRVVSAAKLSEGAFQVIFDRDVTECTYVATLQSGGYMAQAEPLTSDPNGVFVSTYNASGTITSAAFYLEVVC